MTFEWKTFNKNNDFNNIILMILWLFKRRNTKIKTQNQIMQYDTTQIVTCLCAIGPNVYNGNIQRTLLGLCRCVQTETSLLAWLNKVVFQSSLHLFRCVKHTVTDTVTHIFTIKQHICVVYQRTWPQFHEINPYRKTQDHVCETWWRDKRAHVMCFFL